MQETQEKQGWSLGQEDHLEEGTATHSNILAWRIPWTQEPGRLQSTGSHSWTRLNQLSTVQMTVNNVLFSGILLRNPQTPNDFLDDYPWGCLPRGHSHESSETRPVVTQKRDLNHLPSIPGGSLFLLWALIPLISIILNLLSLLWLDNHSFQYVLGTNNVKDRSTEDRIVGFAFLWGRQIKPQLTDK